MSSRKPSTAHLAAAIAVALASWSTSSYAAGLGRLSVHSALGQPLQAEVEVTSVTPDEAASLAARLASPEAFRAAGLQFNNALAGIRMAVEERNGRHYIKVTSPRPINEPFVDLMVELNWASGKFVREYTFLLDPPELRASRQTVEGGSAAAAPVAPAFSARPTPQQPPRSVAQAQAQAPAAPAPRAREAAPAQAASGSVAPAAPAATRPVASAPSAPSASASGGTSGAGSDSVTVARGDTLGKIAANYKPASATLEQTIVAIYQANRGAFIDDNPNLIREGRTLNIPDASAMTAVDAATARRQLRVAARDFRAYKERLAGATTEVARSGTGTTASGSVSAQVEDKASQAPASDQLKLSRSTEAVGGKAGAVGSRDAEAQIARDAALTESNSRIAELERNVADLQKMVELKNKSLADLQAQLDHARASGAAVSGAVAGAGAAANARGATPPASGTASQAPATPAGSTPSEATSPSQAGTSASPASPATAPQASSSDPASSSTSSSPSPAADAGSAPSSSASPAGASSTPEAGTAQARATTPPATPARPPVATTPVEPVAEPGLFDDMMDNPMVLPGLGGLALLGGFGLWLALRRRKVERFEDSLVAADAFTTNSLFGTTGGHSVDTTTGATHTQVTTMSEASPTEVDPIAEADVYIAYGREAQAEEILKEALKRQPERQAIRLKLMEIYSGRKDAQSFEAMAREMHDMTGGQNEEWPKVATMGLALDADNPLYTGGAAPAATNSSFGRAAAATAIAAASAASGSSYAPQRSGDTLIGAAGGFGAAPGVAGGEVAERMPEPQAEEMRAEAPDSGMADLDFNLDLDRTLETTTARHGQDYNEAGEFAASRSGPLSAMPSVDLPSLDLDEPSAPAQGANEQFHVDVPSLEGLNTRTGAQQEPASADMDLSAIGLDLSPSTIAGPQTVTGAASSQWQEMASKLDLASAYGEIGDKEGARELLQEVVRGGDPSQQQKARELLASI